MENSFDEDDFMLLQEPLYNEIEDNSINPDDFYLLEEPLYESQVGGNNNIAIQLENSCFSPKWNCLKLKYKVEFNQLIGNFLEANLMIIEIFDNLCDQIKIYAKQKDKVRVIVNHESLSYPISCPFMPREQLNGTLLINMIEAVCQSKREIKCDNELHISVYIIDLPLGSGNRIDDFINDKGCVKIIVNKDNLCLLRAILLGKAYCDKDINRKKYTSINSNIFDDKIKKVAVEIGLIDKPCGIPEIKKIERYLKDYTVVLIDENGKDILYKGEKKNFYIYIWYTNNHYNLITSITSFYNVKYYCHNCNVKYHNISKHKCDYTCKICNRINCVLDIEIQCDHCKVISNNCLCIKIHQDKYCRVLRKCSVCGNIKFKNHVCLNEKYCFNCREAVKESHECYIKTEEEKGKKEKQEFGGYIFFDYEATQEKGLHEPNLVCVKKICSKCLDNKNNNCTICCCLTFTNNNNFCYWLFKQKYFIALAHNMKGYDGVFIMNYIINNLSPKDRQPQVINNGSKIMYIDFNNVRILDSYSFIPISLSEFSNAFGIYELKKGFFPHLFNTQQNQNYVGQYPDKDLFGYKFLSSKKQKEFDEWYETVKDKEFNFQKEFLEYCWSDVLLLAEGCLEFRKIIKDLSKKNDEGIDPFRSAITIASLCHLIYRRKVLQPNQLAYIPDNKIEKNTSYKSLVWLKYLNKDLQHAYNGGEKKIGNYYVDGYDNITNTIYEFHGCYFHGCPKCFTPETYNHQLQTTMGTIYARHLKRIEYLKNKGRLNEIWECDFDELKNKDLELQKLYKSEEYVEPLIPRDALFGGRTNALKLYHKCVGNDKIMYIDFTSLYPSVQNFEKYPIGHPIKITDNFNTDISQYFGVIKCKILPPRGLLLPVLPIKLDKLIFALCSKCAELKQQSCNHSDNERCITGTWCSPEINRAIKEGYKIIKIYEIWHFPNTSQYNKDTKQGGIFTDYINMFLKGKQEASGYPSNIITDEDKIKYQQDYFNKEGILLELNNIEKNPGKRFVYKLALNSMWGRLGMKTDRNQYKIINHKSDWLNMITDNQYIISGVDFSSDKCLQVYFKNLFDRGSTETSVVHAAMVTCYARLQLFDVLNKIVIEFFILIPILLFLFIEKVNILQN